MSYDAIINETILREPQIIEKCAVKGNKVFKKRLINIGKQLWNGHKTICRLTKWILELVYYNKSIRYNSKVEECILLTNVAANKEFLFL